MPLILGIETSCDETAAAVYDSSRKMLLSHHLFSQITLQAHYGGVIPEIASRSHVEKIGPVIAQTLREAGVSLNDISTVAVTTKPGLVGSLLIGISFAKSIAWAAKKNLIGVNHLEGHIFSSFLRADGSVAQSFPFPHLCLSASGGHTALYLVEDFGRYELLGQTIDDAAGEAFDKVAFMMGFGYPGGPMIEKLAGEINFEDSCGYPRGRRNKERLDFSFSGLKTAVLYDLIKKGAFDFEKGIIVSHMTPQLTREVASSLLVCITEMFEQKIRQAFVRYPQVRGLSFVGGVAANKFITARLQALCDRRDKAFASPPRAFCTDNAAMIAFVAGYKEARGEFSDFNLDVFE